MRRQPVAQRQQIRRRRTERLDQLADDPIDQQTHARPHAGLVNISPQQRAIIVSIELPLPCFGVAGTAGARERLRGSTILLCVLDGDSSGCGKPPRQTE
jgi:hypothetical protein